MGLIIFVVAGFILIAVISGSIDASRQRHQNQQGQRRHHHTAHTHHTQETKDTQTDKRPQRKTSTDKASDEDDFMKQYDDLFDEVDDDDDPFKNYR